ncbi:uncharacterized protein V6R79_013115 [Siganus canaliculatus]
MACENRIISMASLKSSTVTVHQHFCRTFVVLDSVPAQIRLRGPASQRLICLLYAPLVVCSSQLQIITHRQVARLQRNMGITCGTSYDRAWSSCFQPQATEIQE